MAEIINGQPSAAETEEHIVTDEAATALNTTHRGSDGKNHSDVVSNTSGVSANITAIGLNTTHKGSDGSDHSKVGANETAIGLNTTHRGSNGSDHSLVADTIHDNVAGEINAIAEKASPVSADLVVVEDSADSNNKKKVQVGNLPAVGTFSSRIRVTRTSTQSINHNTWTRIDFNIEEYDDNNEYDNVTNYRFVAGATGYYSVSALVGIDTGGDEKHVEIIIRKNGNGTNVLRGKEIPGAVGNAWASVSGDVKLTAGDTLDVIFLQFTGGAKNIAVTAGSCYFTIHRFA